MVSKAQKVDLKEIKKWSINEKAEEKYYIFEKNKGTELK